MPCTGPARLYSQANTLIETYFIAYLVLFSDGDVSEIDMPGAKIGDKDE